MNVFISADIEGTTGVVAWGQCGRPSGDHYDWAFARRMMTHDVNAAVRGARAAGAERVVVKDSHGDSRNLLVDELEPGTELVSGLGAFPQGMVTGVDASFDCAMLVGYHAKAGTANGVMEHTISGAVHHLWINGRECGEMAMAAASCGSLGVPVVTVTSDESGCAEAASFFPGVTTAAVKSGIGRYLGRLLHPSETGPLIEEAARQGVLARAQIPPFVFDEPVSVRLEQNQSEHAEASASVPGWSRKDGYTVEATFATWEEALRSLWRALMNGAAASRWNT